MRPWENANPVWLVWRPEQDETEGDARGIEAWDAEQAAEDWAEHDDQGGDYTIVGGDSATLSVRPRDDASAPVEVFVVSGETVPQYSARAKAEA